MQCSQVPRAPQGAAARVHAQRAPWLRYRVTADVGLASGISKGARTQKSPASGLARHERARRSAKCTCGSTRGANWMNLSRAPGWVQRSPRGAGLAHLDRTSARARKNQV